MSNRSKTYSFSMVEVLIALMLFTCLIPPIVSCFRSFATQGATLQKIKEKQQKLSLCHARLQKIFTSLHSFTKGRAALFFSDGTSITLSYDNSIDSPRFSNNILGKIFTEKDELIFASFPAPKKPAEKEVDMRKEILLETCQKLSLQFWRVDSTLPASNLEQKEKTWHPSWDKKQKPPLLVQMNFLYEKEEHTFYFIIPNSIGTIQYGM